MTFRSLLRGVLVASALLLAPAAFAQSLVGGTVLNGSVPSYNVDATAPFTIDQGTLALRVYVVNGTGGGGGGSSGPAYVGQYNSTLPTFVSGQAGYLSVDSNGRLILSPGGSVSVSNFPATQTVAGTVTVNQGTSPWTVSGTVTANLGTLNGAALDTTLSGVATSNSAISTATGTTADAATASGANSTIIGALRAIRDRLLGTLTTTLAAGSANIGSLTNITGTVSLPTGAATAANQTTEIAAVANRTAYVFEASQSIAASATYTGSTRDPGASPSAYTKFSAYVLPSQAGTAKIQISSDASTWVDAQTMSVSASVGATLSVPIVLRYNRIVFVNGSTAGTLFVASSLLVN